MKKIIRKKNIERKSSDSKIINITVLLISTIICLILFLFFIKIFLMFGPGINQEQETDYEVVPSHPYYLVSGQYHLKYVDDLESMNTLRILNLGDSVTHSECPLTQELQYYLNKNLSDFTFNGRKITGIDVINAGKGGANSKAIFSLFEDILVQYKKPDIITVLTGWNDHWYKTRLCYDIGCYKNAMRISKKGLSEKQFQRLLHIVYMKETEECVEILRDKGVDSILQNVDSYNTSIYRVSLDEYHNKLIEIIDLARENKIDVVLVVPPNGLKKGEVPYISLRDCLLIDKDAYYPVHTMYTSMIRQVANEKNVPVIDLENEFDKHQNKYSLFQNSSYDPIHPNNPGCTLCTSAFYDFFIQYLQNGSVKN